VTLSLRMCQHHWGLLRRVIEARGLDHLVSTTAGSWADAATGTVFDPLMGAVVDLYAMNVGDVMEEGARCPLCSYDEEDALDEINRAADEQLDRAVKLGHIKLSP
jgi:hypothetical protein